MAETVSGGDFMRCETPRILREYMTGARKPASRPDSTQFHTSVVSGAGHFRVHYDTTGYNAPVMIDADMNGIPDYIDSTCVYLEYAWSLLIDTYGFKRPLSDNGQGGGDEIDCYVKNFGTGGYGYTEPITYNGGPSASYMFIDNDYLESQYAAKGYDALKVTTAHEFLHTIHFSHVVDFNLSWWMEQNAVWMEDFAWDDVNDYLAYLTFFFNPVDDFPNRTPLDYNGGNFMYGAGIWAMYLAGKFGPEIIEDSWKRLASAPVRDVSVIDSAIPGGIAPAYHEFAIWNYFTDFRANTVDFHRDSDLFGCTVPLENSVGKTPANETMASNHLTSRYVELLFSGMWDATDAVRVRIISGGVGVFNASLVLYNDPYQYSIRPVTGGDALITLDGEWDKAVLVVSCTSTRGYNHSFSYETEIVYNTGIRSANPHEFAVRGVYPNPFNPSTSVDFSISEPGRVSVSVFNAAGQKIDSLFDGDLAAGDKRLLWKPDTGLAGGVYFITVETPRGVKTAKALFLK